MPNLHTYTLHTHKLILKNIEAVQSPSPSLNPVKCLFPCSTVRICVHATRSKAQALT